MEINGLPLHALVTHAAVIFGPLAALAGLLYAVVPPWRDKLRWPLVVVVAVAVGAIWTAYVSGGQLLDANPNSYQGEFADLVDTHQSRARILRWVASGFGLVTLAAAWWHSRPGAMRALLAALVAVGAAATGVYVVLTGDAGAQIAWYGVNG
jgi:hypothetical protein